MAKTAGACMFLGVAACVVPAAAQEVVQNRVWTAAPLPNACKAMRMSEAAIAITANCSGKFTLLVKDGNIYTTVIEQGDGHGNLVNVSSTGSGVSFLAMP